MEEKELIQPKLLAIEILDNSERAKILITVFGVLAVLLLVGLFSGYNELQLLKRVQIGAFVSEDEANTSDLMQRIFGILQFGLIVTSIIVFLNWFRRAYGNLHRLRINNIKHEESMSVWSWFIPIVSFFRPVQIMNEIWNVTQQNIQKFDSSYRIKNGDLIIGIWWAFFIISNFIGKYILKSAFKDETLEQIIVSSQAMLISDAFQIVETVVVIYLVHQVSKMESKMADEIKNSGGIVLKK